MKTKASHRVLSSIGFPLFVVAGLVIVWVYRAQLYSIFGSPERLREWVSTWGYVAPLVFIALQILQVVLFVIPGEVAQVAGGYIFGMWAGMLYSIVGILLGSSFNFFLARLLGVPFVSMVFGTQRLSRFDAVLTSQRATVAFFLLFLIPGIPKDALCYIAGLSTLRFPLFMLISTVGRLPGIVGSSALGGAAANQMWITVGTIGAIAVVLFVAGLLYRDRLQRLVEGIIDRRGPQLDSPDERRRRRRRSDRASFEGSSSPKTHTGAPRTGGRDPGRPPEANESGSRR